MDYEQKVKIIYSGLAAPILLANAPAHDIHLWQRNTVAVHIVPPLAGATGTLSIYGSVLDDTIWYTLLGSVNLATATETTKYFNIVNSIANGAAIRHVRFEINPLGAGTVIDLAISQL